MPGPEPKPAAQPAPQSPSPLLFLLRLLSGVSLQGFQSPKGFSLRLLGYEPSSLQYRLAWLPGVLLPCTVWSLPGNLVQSLLAVLNAYVFSLVYDMDKGHGEYLKVVTFGRTWVATLVAFVLGGFVLANVGKWSRKRGTYGLLCGKTREQLICVAAFLQGKDCQRALAYRQRFGRLALLALELAVQKARGAMDDAATEKWLRQLQLLEADEWERMVPGDRHTTVFFWLLSLAEEALREGLLSEEAARSVFESVKAARGAANDLMDLLPNAMPFPYAQVVTFMVKTHTFICSTEFGMKLADARHSPQFSDGVPLGYMLLTLGVVYMINACMQGLLDLQAFLHNPFLEEVNGVPHEAIANEGLAKLSKELMGQGVCRPLPLSAQPVCQNSGVL